MALPSVGAIQAALRLAIEGAYREKEKATHRLDECDALEHELAERRDTPPYLPHLGGFKFSVGQVAFCFFCS